MDKTEETILLGQELIKLITESTCIDSSVSEKFVSKISTIINIIRDRRKLCACCEQNYFIGKSKNAKYCKNCVGKGYIKKVKADPFLKAYNTEYKTRHSRMMREVRRYNGEDIFHYADILENELSKWRAYSRVAMADYKKIYEETTDKVLRNESIECFKRAIYDT